MKKTLPPIPDPVDSYARVELYRWQHGHLPSGTDIQKPLNVAAGLNAMAAAIEKGDIKNFPTPDNVVAVLQFTARLIENQPTNEIK